MRSLSLLGCVLIVAGALGLVMEYMVFDETRAILEAGPLKNANSDESDFSIAAIVGFLALAAGAALLFFGGAPKRGRVTSAESARGKRSF